MALVGDGPERCLDIVPPPLIVKSPANQLRDERAAAPVARPLIELGNELVVNGDVQSHVPRLAHWTVPGRVQLSRRWVPLSLSQLTPGAAAGGSWSRLATSAGTAVHEQARAFYARFDFEHSPTDPLHLLLLIKDARALLDP